MKLSGVLGINASRIESGSSDGHSSTDGRPGRWVYIASPTCNYRGLLATDFPHRRYDLVMLPSVLSPHPGGTAGREVRFLSNNLQTRRCT